jgi:2-hydroxychromene-2-carboxylate isomerase
MRFYFDYVSPYAYVAWHQLPGIAARHTRPIEPVPVVFGALLGAHGAKGPAEIAPKRAYLLKTSTARRGGQAYRSRCRPRTRSIRWSRCAPRRCRCQQTDGAG